MTDAHQDVAGVVERLRWLSSPDAERMSDYQRINNFVACGVLAADLIESLSKALSEAEAERDYQTRFVQELQTALAFWMPGVDLRLDEATRELAADDAYLLAGSTGERDLPCWGDGILERALAAESRLAEAMKVIEPFSDVLGEDDDDQPDGTKITVDYKWHVYHALRLHHFRAARRFLNAWKE